MKQDFKIHGLSKLGDFIRNFLENTPEDYSNEQAELFSLMKKSEIENPWFTIDNQKFCFKNWADVLTIDSIQNWLSAYQLSHQSKKIGLILAGNIPLVGFHDVICAILSNHIPMIKLSSKDRLVLPFLLNKWGEFSEWNLEYQFVEKLTEYDAVIATGSNNTARYLEYYFKDASSIIRKNRTSVAIINGDETDEELQLLAEDIFRYFGLGCRNVTRLFIPKDFELSRLFENFLNFKDIINHHKYANNYDYNRAIYLLNQEKFWDNNFVMLKEDEHLFSPLSVLNFSRYENLDNVKLFLTENSASIQCVVAKPELGIGESVHFGEAQNPSLDTYADNVDTMKFLEVI